MSQVPFQPPAPISREILCAEENIDFVYPCTPRQCLWKPGENLKTSPHSTGARQERPKILPNVLYAIGNTPLIRLNNIPKAYGIKCEMLAKCEFFNPTGSVKDRVALNMILDAERKGLLHDGDLLIEPTAGNTGLGLAMCANLKGYRNLSVMPMRMSTDKVNVLKALGSKVVRTPKGELGTKNCIFKVSQRLCKETANSIVLDQFRNASNPMVHYETTAEEILEQCDGKVDAVVGGSGTGGTLTGIGRKMKEKRPTCKIIGADPLGSLMAEPSELNDPNIKILEMEGIGMPFTPATLDKSIVSKWYKVSDKDSMLMARRLVAEEGILCGGSSGTAMCAAIEEAKTMSEDQRLVVILPDSLRNYLTKFVNDPWMKMRGYIDMDPYNTWWWSKIPVKVLDLKIPNQIPTGTDCSSAIQYMNSNELDQVFVAQQSGTIIGVITPAQLLSDIMEQKCALNDIIDEIVEPIRTVNEDTPLAIISAIVQIEKIVLVELRTKENGKNGSSHETKFATAKELLAYISKNHSDK